jgi:ABC-type dipeptide/oligopeptide/nickel transport system ATPase subunit
MNGTMPLLRVQGMVKTFARHGVRVLDGLGFSVAAGECVAVLGKSGCGKSTLARCLAGLEPMTEGMIEIEGSPHHTSIRRQRRLIQMVWQDSAAALSPFLSIGKSIKEPLESARIGDLASAVGLRAELLDRRPHQLSGGEAQRAGIARALAADPKVLILDEPLSALDPVTQVEILPFLRTATHAPGRAALFISHDLTAVRLLADRVIFLDGGKVVEDRRVEAFLSAPDHPVAQEFLSAWPALPF